MDFNVEINATNIFISLTSTQNVLLAALIAVAVGTGADLLFDLKAGFILNTSHRLLTRAQFIGVVTSSLVVGISLISLVKVYTLGSPELFAMQAQIVAYMIGNINWLYFGIGILTGAEITLLGYSGLAFGVGFFIPLFFSVGFALGGTVRFVTDKKYPYLNEKMRLISAGLIGGEGITGALLAMVRMFTL